MRGVTRLAWAAAAVAATASGAFAQQTTGGTGGGSTGTGTGGTGGGSDANTPQLAAVVETPQITAPSDASNAGTSALSPSNFLAPTFANVYYQGRAGADPAGAPGGFGVALYGTTTGVGGGRGGTVTGGNIGFAGSSTGGLGSVTGVSSGGRGGTTGSIGGASGFGGTGGRTGSTGGLGGTGAGTAAGGTGGQLIQLPRQIAYTAVLKFPTPAVVPTQLQADLRGMIDRSAMIGNPQGVEVMMDANAVVLRGAVKDEDEARMVEGMVRLTPGVRDVRNELSFPPSATP